MNKKKGNKDCFFVTINVFLQERFPKSFVCHLLPYCEILTIGRAKYFLNNGVVVGKKNLDSSWSRYCCWQNNFLLFLIHILLNLDLSCLHISNGFYQRKSSKFLKVTKIMPNKKSHLFLKFNYTQIQPLISKIVTKF